MRHLETRARAWVAERTSAYGRDWANLYDAFLDGSSAHPPVLQSFDASSGLAVGRKRVPGFRDSTDTLLSNQRLVRTAAVEGENSLLNRLRLGSLSLDDLPANSAITLPLCASTAQYADFADSASLSVFVRDYKPALGSAAYTSANPFSIGGYYGQCTWFAWGRFYEVYGEKLPCLGNAGGWIDHAGGWPTSTRLADIKPGCVAVWRRKNPDYPEQGHVAFIEDVVGTKVLFNEANVDVKGQYDGAGPSGASDEVELSALAMHMGSNYEFAGFIFPKNPSAHLPGHTVVKPLLSAADLAGLETTFAFRRHDLAGITAGSATRDRVCGGDRRIPSGSIIVERLTGSGVDATRTVGIRVASAVRYTVWDSIDFSTPDVAGARPIAPVLERLQSLDRAYPVPFEVTFVPAKQESYTITPEQLSLALGAGSGSSVGTSFAK